MLAGLTVLCLPASNNTAFYPSKLDLQSSLTIYNAFSSPFTLATMTWVALGIPFVLTYIVYVWKLMDSKKTDCGRNRKEIFLKGNAPLEEKKLMSAVLLITYVALIAVSHKGIFMVLEKTDLL